MVEVFNQCFQLYYLINNCQLRICLVLSFYKICKLWFESSYHLKISGNTVNSASAHFSFCPHWFRIYATTFDCIFYRRSIRNGIHFLWMGIILRHPAGGILQAFAAAENPNLSWKKSKKSCEKGTSCTSLWNLAFVAVFLFTEHPINLLSIYFFKKTYLDTIGYGAINLSSWNIWS